MPPADLKKPIEARDEYENRPAAANNLLRALSSMMTWSRAAGWQAVGQTATGSLSGGYCGCWADRRIQHR
jgi:hypothetical protein